MNNITDREQSEAQSHAYRNSCKYRRKGHVIEQKGEDGTWKGIFDGSDHLAKNQAGKGINKAKKEARKLMANGHKLYVV